MTGSCRDCPCRGVYVVTWTHGVSLDYRNQRSARKHRDVVLSHCRTVRSTPCVLPQNSQIRREHDWFPQTSTPSPDTTSSYHRPGPHNLKLPALLLPGCAAMPVLAAPQSARHQSALICLSDGLSSLRRYTADRLNFYMANQLDGQCSTQTREESMHDRVVEDIKASWPLVQSVTTTCVAWTDQH